MHKWTEESATADVRVKHKTDTFSTPLRHPDRSPVWNYTVNLGLAASEGDILKLQVTQGSDMDKVVARGAFDVWSLPKDTIITRTLDVGSAPKSPRTRGGSSGMEESITDLMGRLRDQDLESTDGASGGPTLTFKILDKLKTSCRLYFVRHGESKWNEARREKKYRKLIHFDHILTYAGIQQSEQLRAFWHAKRKESPNDPELKRFLSADRVLSSPLSRALQTCLLALHDHPTAEKDGVTLCRDLREVKSVGGLDSQGKCYGAAILQRCEEKLLKKYKQGLTERGSSRGELTAAATRVLDICTRVKIDYNDAHTQWWVLKDSSSDVESRIEDFLCYIRYCPGNTFICVGHSMFIKALFTHRLADAWARENPETAQNLKREKLTNAGCVAVDIDFSSIRPSDWKITNARLVFETGFQFKHKKGKSQQIIRAQSDPPFLNQAKAALGEPTGGAGALNRVHKAAQSPKPRNSIGGKGASMPNLAMRRYAKTETAPIEKSDNNPLIAHKKK